MQDEMHSKHSKQAMPIPYHTMH